MKKKVKKMTTTAKRKRKGRGRPTLGGEGESPNRTIRIPAERWTEWKRKAADEGVPISDWIRGRCDNGGG